jgi:hypothetical protein
MARAFSWIKISSLRMTFLWNQATMMRFRCARYCKGQRYGTTGWIKQMGTQNESEDGRCAWVTLCAHPNYIDEESLCNYINKGKPKNWGKKICHTASLFTTNSTWTDPGANPGLRGERPARETSWAVVRLTKCVQWLVFRDMNMYPDGCNSYSCIKILAVAWQSFWCEGYGRKRGNTAGCCPCDVTRDVVWEVPDVTHPLISLAEKEEKGEGMNAVRCTVLLLWIMVHVVEAHHT